MDCGQKILSFYYSKIINDNFWVFDIIFINIFSFFILKTKLYRYQYLSLLVIIILGIFLNIIYFLKEFNINNDDKIMDILFNILLTLGVEILYSLTAVINKYSMEKNFCIPYELSFYEGIFALIVNIILLKFIVPGNFSKYYNNINSTEIISFISLMLSRLIFNLFGLITIKIYTSSHIALLLVIGEIAFSLWEKYIWYLFIKIIINFIIYSSCIH